MVTATVAYLRVSTEQQATDGVSLDAQRAKVEAYASLYDLELVDVIVEAGSGKSLARPGLQRALDMLGSGAEAFLVCKLDRLTRSVRDLGTLIDQYFHRWPLVSVAEQIDTRSAAGRLVLNVLVSVAQWERETIGERTSEALRHMQREGRYTGGHVPYGQRLGEGGELQPCAMELRVVGLARDWRAAGWSLRRIAAELHREGIVSRSGARFAPMQVRRMLSEVEQQQ